MGNIACPVSEPVTINPRIVESLYCEALVLADEVRSAFAASARPVREDELPDLVRVALSCEALRTTTRMMNAIAWLLNHRAYFMGELSEFQLRRHGRLLGDAQHFNPAQRALVPHEVRDLIEATERFHARLCRLDARWRRTDDRATAAITRLRDRIETRVRG